MPAIEATAAELRTLGVDVVFFSTLEGQTVAVQLDAKQDAARKDAVQRGVDMRIASGIGHARLPRAVCSPLEFISVHRIRRGMAERRFFDVLHAKIGAPKIVSASAMLMKRVCNLRAADACERAMFWRERQRRPIHRGQSPRIMDDRAVKSRYLCSIRLSAASRRARLWREVARSSPPDAPTAATARATDSATGLSAAERRAIEHTAEQRLRENNLERFLAFGDGEQAATRGLELELEPLSGEAVWQARDVLSRDECEAVRLAASIAARARGGWDRTRHRKYPTQDLPLRCLPAPLRQRVCEALFRRVIRPLAPTFCGPAFLPEMLEMRDAFVVQYDADDPAGQRALAMHTDASLFSVNVLLSDPEREFIGGGTLFDFVRKGLNEEDGAGAEPVAATEGSWTVRPAQGTAIVHSGQLLHGGLRIERGKRYILVGFIEVRRETPYAVDDSCAAAADAFAKFGHAAWTREALGSGELLVRLHPQSPEVEIHLAAPMRIDPQSPEVEIHSAAPMRIEAAAAPPSSSAAHHGPWMPPSMARANKGASDWAAELGARIQGNSFAPFVPTRTAQAARLVALGGITASDVVCDLGCGDASLLCTLVRQTGCSAIGCDVNGELLARARARIADDDACASRIVLSCALLADFMQSAAFEPTTVLLVFLVPQQLEALAPDLRAAILPSAGHRRLLSLRYPIPGLVVRGSIGDEEGSSSSEDEDESSSSSLAHTTRMDDAPAWTSSPAYFGRSFGGAYLY